MSISSDHVSSIRPSASDDASPSLDDLGWSAFFRSQLDSLPPHLVPGRVVRAERGHYLLLGAAGASHAELGGRLRHEAADPFDFPATGDWVAATPAIHGGPARVEHVLRRRSVLARKRPGRADGHADAQLLVANVDVMGVVTSLNEDFNPRRIERYVAMAIEGGASPLVILSKSDLPSSPEQFEREARAAAPDVPVLRVSAAHGEGVYAVRDHLGPGRTLALVGSSGVGKSTLVNALVGREVRATGAIREADDRGRHVTTHRELVPLPAGGVLVDTPGLRELGLLGGDDGAIGGFDEIDALAVTCRFRDCKHEGEPGCAVERAIEAGVLDPARLANRRKLERELGRHDPEARAAQKRRSKEIARTLRSLAKGQRGR